MFRPFCKLTRALTGSFVSPPFVGAAHVLVLVLVAARGAHVDALGGAADRAPTMMAMGGAAVGLGLAIGLVVALLGRLRRRSATSPCSLLRRFVETWVGVAVLHSLLVVWSMADAPQLYAARWYAQGGLSRLVQVLATDGLGPRGVIVVACVLVLLYVEGGRVVDRFRRVISATRTRFTTFARRGAVSASALVVVFGGGAVGARLDPPSSPPATSPPSSPSKPLNVLILAVDSLRNDRLDPKIAPNLSRLAAQGTRFDRAYVSTSRSPSWITTLTGRHAHHHGIRSMLPTSEERARDFDAMPARFTKSGYATAVLGDFAGDLFGRTDLGFATVDVPTFDLRRTMARELLDRETPLLPVLHSRLGRKMFPAMRAGTGAADPRVLGDEVEAALGRATTPFFLTVSFSTARFPYAAPAPYYAKFTAPSYRGRFKYHEPGRLGSAPEVPLDADDVRQVRALYDGSVAAIDDAAGRVIAALERFGHADDTILVVTSNHGENLFEQGRGEGHGDHLFGDESTHVPLVIVDPRSRRGSQGGRREPSVVRDVDIAPTVYELAGIPAPPDLDGRSLVPALRGEPLAPRFAYAESELWLSDEIPGLPSSLRMPYPGATELTRVDADRASEVVPSEPTLAKALVARHRMIRDRRFKLIYVPTRTGVRYMLYDTEHDPAETEDVSARLPAEVARLRAELWSWMLEDPQMEPRGGYLVPRETGGSEAYEVALRLVERANEARFEMPHEIVSRAVADAHRRQRRSAAFVETPGEASRNVANVALRGAASDGPARDTRSWNMAEGFDQREALVASTPGSVSFRVDVPRGARLSFAEGTLNAAAGATSFVVTVVDAAGVASEVYRHALASGADRQWTDASCDLSSFAGQNVELRLSTEAPHPKPGATVALWGHPTILARTTAEVPYNVLWIAVDALPTSAPMPELEQLARDGVRFTDTYSAGTWTRPGTIAMLGGARSGELGIDGTTLTMGTGEARRFYLSDPPLLSAILRRHGVATRAFVNNDFMVDDGARGVDMAFERLVAHRDRTRDTRDITDDARRFLEGNEDARFFAYVNLRAPPPSEASAAMGVLMRTLEGTGLRDRTIVVVTSAHGVATPLEHRSVDGFEETTKVPLVISLPKVLPRGRDVTSRVRSIDIAPTVLDLLGVEHPPKMTGASLLPLARGETEADERVVVSEGMGSRAILRGRWRLVERARPGRSGSRRGEANVELYDRVDEPGERRDLAAERPEVVAEMRARLDAAMKNLPVAGARADVEGRPGARAPTLRLRFAGGGEARRVSGTIRIGDDKVRATGYDVEPIGLGRDAFHREEGQGIDVSFRTDGQHLVGFDIVAEPAGVPITWELWLDDEPWPTSGVFGGPYGLLAPLLGGGVASDEARHAARARPGALPTIDPSRDLGLFVVRARGFDEFGGRRHPEKGADDVARLLREWGYVPGSSAAQ